MDKNINLLHEINKNEYTIHTFNIFIKDVDYKIKFTALIQRLKKITEFKDLTSLFPDIDLNLIEYIKTYSTSKEEEFQNIVLFNPNLYKENKNELQANPNISYKVIESNENTDKIIDYISCNRNFISDFLTKQNKKVFISTPALKATMFNKEVLNINLKTTKKEFDSKIYTKGKKNYLFNKERFIEFNIKKEQLLTNIRFVLPNVFIIYLIDQSYIYQNKIIISDTLKLGDIVFENIIEKYKYIINLYEKIFEDKLTESNTLINISIKKDNKENLKNNPFLFNLETNIIVTEKNINFKYITSYEDFKNREKIINDCLMKQNNLYAYINKLNKNALLFYKEESANNILNNIFNI